MTVETETSKCPYCGEPVTSYWTPEGCLSNPEYTLVADFIFHTKCWDEQVEKNPP
jgi:hypothetical protein